MNKNLIIKIQKKSAGHIEPNRLICVGSCRNAARMEIIFKDISVDFDTSHH
jgi:hypothetical protein